MFGADGVLSIRTLSSRSVVRVRSPKNTDLMFFRHQCVSEGWTDKIKEQSDEGCNVAGKVRVNKVIGNFHLSPGRSFQANAMHVHDLVPYLQDGNKHDFGHRINRFSFQSETEEEFVGRGGITAEQTKKSLGITNPLDGLVAHTEESNYSASMAYRLGHRSRADTVSFPFAVFQMFLSKAVWRFPASCKLADNAARLFPRGRLDQVQLPGWA